MTIDSEKDGNHNPPIVGKSGMAKPEPVCLINAPSINWIYTKEAKIIAPRLTYGAERDFCFLILIFDWLYAMNIVTAKKV